MEDKDFNELREKIATEINCALGIIRDYIDRLQFLEDRDGVNSTLCVNCGHDKSFHDLDSTGRCVYGLTFSTEKTSPIVNLGCECKKFSDDTISAPATWDNLDWNKVERMEVICEGCGNHNIKIRGEDLKCKCCEEDLFQNNYAQSIT